MNRNFLYIFGLLFFSSVTMASDSFYAGDGMDRSSVEDPEEMSKTFIINGGLGGVTGNFVSVNASLLLLGAGVLLWGLAGAVALYFLLTAPASSGYSGYSSGGHSGGGGGGYSRGRYYNSWDGSFNTFDGINWEQFTILDFLAIAEDAYRNFDPANLSCQQRLICEIHQNADTMGASAKTMVDWLSYLQYAEVLSLPEEVKALAEEYLDAADRGRNKEKECGVVYDGCNFSIKKLMKNLSHNEIKK